MSNNRRAINWRLVLTGLGLQAMFGIIVLKTGVGQAVFRGIGNAITGLLGFQEQGARFVFGNLVQSNVPVGLPGAGGQLDTSAGMLANTGAFFAFNVLPTIIFFSSLMAVLYYLGVMQWIVHGLAVVMQRGMGASGAESLNMAANIFMGQSEAPLTIRPYLSRLTNSELMTVMTGGMATISGALLVAYSRIGGIAAEHLLTAVVMTAPAAIMLSKIMEPETEQPETMGGVPKGAGSSDVNLIDAAARGASEGLYLALNVGAVLIAFIALIALSNSILGWIHQWPALSWLPESLQAIFGIVFAPVAWLLGVAWHDATTIGNLLGTRMVINEFVAYAELGTIKDSLDPKSFLIAGDALCGFANFGSIGIQVCGDGALIPERRHDLARLGLRAMLAGTMANFMTACWAGLLAA
jgi:CNT family concentrative nucleoside transporter